MAIISLKVRQDMDELQKKIERSGTGTIITVGPAPNDIQKCRQISAHDAGILSTTRGDIKEGDVTRINDTEICRGGNKSVCSFYDGVFRREQHREGEKTIHEFWWLILPKSRRTAQEEAVFKSGFRIEADKLTDIPLTSSKGLLLFVSLMKHGKLVRQVLLLKKFRFLGSVWNWISEKNAPDAYDGPFVYHCGTPSSFIYGKEAKNDKGKPIMQYFRGHKGSKKGSIYDHEDNVLPDGTYATDNDFFIELKTETGEKIIVSAKEPKKAIHHCEYGDEFFALSNALVVKNGKTIREVNGAVITKTFEAELVVPYSQGLYYVRNGMIYLLVINGPAGVSS